MKIGEITQQIWKELVKPGDIVIDATLGGGNDTLFLTRLLQGKGILYAYDIQERALEKSKELIYKELTENEHKIIQFRLLSHVSFHDIPKANLIVYNLGYLPGGDKSLTTQWQTTLESLKSAMEICEIKGAISITCYIGHEEGQKEHKALLEFVKKLPKNEWGSLHLHWENRDLAPELFLLFRER